MSLGRCMGDWLEDTSEGAAFVAQKMVDARQAPRVVLREMQGFVRGLSDEIDLVAEGVRARAAGAAASRARPPSPPSSNTGGKVPRETPAPGRKGRA